MRIFINAMKNDLYDMGDDTVIVWVTDSGVPAGETLARYLAQLREDGVGTEDALICPNGYARGRYVGLYAPKKLK